MVCPEPSEQHQGRNLIIYLGKDNHEVVKYHPIGGQLPPSEMVGNRVLKHETMT